MFFFLCVNLDTFSLGEFMKPEKVKNSKKQNKKGKKKGNKNNKNGNTKNDETIATKKIRETDPKICQTHKNNISK